MDWTCEEPKASSRQFMRCFCHEALHSLLLSARRVSSPLRFYFLCSCLVLSCLVLSCLVLSCLVLSCLVLSCLVLHRVSSSLIFLRVDFRLFFRCLMFFNFLN